jgi:DNA-binding winged helix-turn-helix (wHTH) protein
VVGAERTRPIRFADFEADLRTGELWQGGGKIPLQEQPFRVLAMLLERAGDLITREELRRRIWPGAVFVDFDHGLNKAVSKLRRALNDSADSPSFVETLPGRGYRFIGALIDCGRRTGTVGIYRVLYNDRSIPLLTGPNVIGRDLEATVFVEASSVSRRHARIVVTADGVALEDLGSKNGTFVNGRRVTGSASLRNGDEVRVGTVRLVFGVSTAASTETVSGGWRSS